MIKTRILLLTFLLLLIIATIATAKASKPTGDHLVFLPLILNEREYIIDCIDGEGNLIPCQGE